MTDPTATESFAQPDDFGDLHASELHSSMGESLYAQASDAFMGGTRSLIRASQYLGAQYGVDPLAAAGAADAGVAGIELYDKMMAEQAAQPDVPIAQAREQVKAAGLEGHLKLPDQETIRRPVLDMMLEDARDRARYAAAVDRGPQGFIPGALGFATQIGAGMIDPVNAAAFSIPVMGEARYGQILARAGESVLGRAAIKGGVGAVQGAVGGAALAPLDWWLHTQDGQDYTFADALKSVVLSAGMGAVAHGSHGLGSDILARVRGLPLEGAPAVGGTHLPEAAFGKEGINLDEVPGVAPAAPVHPAEVLADLPQAAQEDVVHAATASLINGGPVNVGEMLAEAAKEDPRIAESIEAWHGSPYDFDKFDLSKIGTGEGAQSYGYGLYFAENPSVARSYAIPRTGGGIGFVGKSSDLPGANLYRVRIDADPEHFLDWDKPLSEQSPQVQKAAQQIIAEHPEAPWFEWKGNKNISGQGFYSKAGYALGSDRATASQTLTPYYDDAATQRLKEAGIPGIKYLDQGSRGSGEGTRNYVVFDDKLVRITHKNGEEVGLDEIKSAEPAGTQAGAERADWQSLARKPQEDHNIADASRAAEKTEPPPDTPEKSVSLIEQKLAEAEKSFQDILPTLSDDERKTIEDALSAVDSDKQARTEMTQQLTACLMGAIA